MVLKVSLYFSVIVTPYPLGIFLLLLTIPELMKKKCSYTFSQFLGMEGGKCEHMKL